MLVLPLFLSSKIVTLSPKRSSNTFLPRGKTVVKRVGSDGIIPEQDVIVNVSEQFVLGAVRVLIDKFAFQSVEVTLHRGVVVRTSGAAHALGYVVGGAEVGEFLRGVLGTLVAVKYHAVFQHPWVLTYCCFKRFNPKLCRNISAMYACDNAAVI